MEENKEMLELLQKIEKTNRQQVRLTRIICIFALITALCFVCTTALVCGMLPQIQALITQAQTVLANLETATKQLSAVDFAGMVSNVETLVTTAQESLAQTTKNLNTLDFETLNKAIADLADVVEPLSKLANIFK